MIFNNFSKISLSEITLHTMKCDEASAICLIFNAVFTLTRSSKPFSKRQQMVWKLECELGVISDPDCPVDGSWSPWGPWSPCSGLCDAIGHQRRTRKCNNPPQTDEGLPCSGPEEEIQPCYLTNCTVDSYRQLIKGDYARTEALRQLEAVPALMERCLQMECPFEAIEAALTNDNTWQLYPELLWNSLQCVKYNFGCPVVGEWGAWGPWSACGARCGEGLRWRLRRCNSPPPSEAHLVCSGTPLQAEECEGDQCALDIRNVDDEAKANWSEWGKWTECSEKCGLGVKRRRRICNEQIVSRSVGSWGTHCTGQHDQFEVCEQPHCLLDGGWSGWGSWGPCSQTCGAGKKSRTRSCTRPIPAGRGLPCVGPRTETRSCYIAPCEVYGHIVAFLNGDSVINYDFKKKRSTLFHFYTRFMPLGPRGTLVRRGAVHNPRVRLSLRKWHVCLEANGQSQMCSPSTICTPTTLEPAVWHSALVTVTSESATLRIDDARTPLKSTFMCDPDLPDESMNLTVGEKMHGAIQEIVVNFIPLEIIYEKDFSKRSSTYPTVALNIAYDKASLDEAFLLLENGQYLRLPCFDEHDDWRIELTIKSKRESGSILFLQDNYSNNWLSMDLQNSRLRLNIAIGDFRSESTSSTECLPDQWLDITLSKKRQANAIEAVINSGERLHVILEEETTRNRRETKVKSKYSHSQPLEYTPYNIVVKHDETTQKHVSLCICSDEFYVGGIPGNLKYDIVDRLPSFTGTIASISINNVLQDLYLFSIEMYKDGKVQVSSRTASVSDTYHETAWGNSNRLNLTCLHARTIRSPGQTAHWLYLDTGISQVVREKAVRSIDDGRVLKLVATADNDLRGFYTCRAHSNKRTRNIVTYGVLGKIKYNLTSPDTTTAIAVVTTFMLIIFTLGWLIYEGIQDLRNGFGFFRDWHLPSEEEAEAVCRFIDENRHLIGSESTVNIAKARARRKGRKLASRASFAAQEPQGFKQIERHLLGSFNSASFVEMPTLAEVKSTPIEECSNSLSINVSCPKFVSDILPISKPLGQEVTQCEMCYISSPRHQSKLSSPRSKFTSSSSLENSPRAICSRLLLAKRVYSPRRHLKKLSNSPIYKSRKIRSQLLAIESSTYCFQKSPAHKVLQRFRELKNEDE